MKYDTLITREYGDKLSAYCDYQVGVAQLTVQHKELRMVLPAVVKQRNLRRTETLQSAS